MTHDPKVSIDNQQSPRLHSRAEDTQNGAPPIKITLYTVDNAVIKYMTDRIKPIVTQNGAQVVVPIVYGDPERWKSSQVDGVLRDSVGKVQLPIIMLRRTTMRKTNINSPVNKYYERSFQTGWNRRNPYDRFAVTNKIKPSVEYFNVTATPDYYAFTYKCVIWTEYMEQMNTIIENISFEAEEFWGEPNSYKFRTTIRGFDTTTQLPANGDRIVKTQFDMNVYGYLLPDSQLDVGHNRELVTKKRYGVKKIVTFTEVDD
jgi:hypothetical protein